MGPIRSIKGHPVAAYFLITYALTWGGVLAAAGTARFQGRALPAEQLAPVMLAMLLGPSVAGLLVTALIEGGAGLRQLLAGIGSWRVAPRWYALALVALPLLATSLLLTLAARVSPAFAPRLNLLYGVPVGLLAGFFEELGWTGLATRRLLARHSVLRSGLLVGLLWGLWHSVAGFIGSAPGQEPFWLAEFALYWIAVLTVYRVLMTWVYSKTGSLLVAQLMHAASTGAMVALTPPLAHGQTLHFEALLLLGLLIVTGLALATEQGRAEPALIPALRRGGG
jgi:membrane protease YdiL (CAAX protease family)